MLSGLGETSQHPSKPSLIIAKPPKESGVHGFDRCIGFVRQCSTLVGDDQGSCSSIRRMWRTLDQAFGLEGPQNLGRHHRVGPRVVCQIALADRCV